MAIDITVPELGESVLEATVSRWLKKEGDYVNVGDVLVELETDKVNLEVGAKGAGVLQKIEATEGADVKVGDVLGRIDEKAAEQKAEAPKAAEQATEEPKPEPVAEPKQPEPQAEKEEPAARTDGQQMERQPAPQVSPVAARLARDKNVDISKITGTGNEGRVTKADVEMYLQQQQTAQVTEKQAPAAEARPSF
jgi:2-oxoglutarate dehydrogenase E2 component (dihydrolipoamide succinyltransferase)